MRRFLSILTALFLFAGVIPVQASANSDAAMPGAGTADDPYIIMTLDQLDAVRDNMTAHYKLGADIDASETAGWNDGAGFVPIGGNSEYSSKFTGVFEGQGHVIWNLTINRPLTDYIGLFGIIGADGAVRNVGIAGGYIAGNTHTGGLAGFNLGIVDQAYFTGDVRGSDGVIGGLAGYSGIQGTVTDSYAAGTVSGADLVGGLVGRSDGTVNASYASSSVSGNAYVGGLVGDNEAGSVIQSYATGIVSGSDEIVGGLVGFNNAGIVSQSYATGAVSGLAGVGGLVGGTDAGLISQSYATGTVGGTNNIGGLVGSNSGDFNSSFWDVEATGQSSACGSDTYGDCNLPSAPTGLTTAQALTQTSYSGWDLTTDWFMIDGSTRPFLRSEWSRTIRNTHQLQLMAMDLTEDYELASDINFGATFTDGSQSDMWATNSSAGAGFAPIGGNGDLGEQYTGKFDGLNHTIRNLTINRSGQDNIGLFKGLSSGGAVRNVGLKDGFVRGGSYTGGLVGYNYTGTIDNAYSTLSVSGNQWVGGLIGFNDAGNMTNSYASGNVGGYAYVGGLVGSQVYGTINRSFASGDVNGNGNDNTHIGGLIGTQNSGTVSESYATGSVSGQYKVGGLVGQNDKDSAVNRSYATGSVGGQDFVGGLAGRNEEGMLSNVYATGAVKGRSEVGGLVGRNVGAVSHTFAAGSVDGSSDIGGQVGRNFSTVTSSFYDSQTSGRSDTGKGEPRTTSEMKQQSAFETGWDFANIWTIEAGKAYPTLRGITANIGLDAAPPTIVSMTVEDEHPGIIIATFDEEVEVAGTDGIHIHIDGSHAAITNVSGTGTKVLTFTLSEVVEHAQAVILSYDMQLGNIVDMANNPLHNFTDRNVENNLSLQDKIPPTVSITMTKADGSAYTSGDWTNASVTVRAVASDDKGVSSFVYSTDNEATWNNYAEDIVFQVEGVYPISFKAVDAAGNASVERRSVKISTSGLKLTPALKKADGSAYKSGDWTNASVTASVYAEAGASEIVALTYSLDGGAAQAYENEAPIVFEQEGAHVILYEVTDKAGNSLSATLTVKIDKTAPSVNFDPNGNETWRTAATSTVTVSDTGSGTDGSTLQYAWTADMSMPSTGWAPFANGVELKQSGADGDRYLHIRAQDFAGNLGHTVSSRYRTDSSAARLSGLTLSEGTLSPAFAAGTANYSVSVGNSVSNITITPVAEDWTDAITVSVNGGAARNVASGNRSESLALHVGANTITLHVKALNGLERTYTVSVTRVAGGTDHSSSGNTLPLNNHYVGMNGRSVTFNGGQIIIPAGALDRSFFLTFYQINNTDALPFSNKGSLVSKVIDLTKDQAGKFDKDVTLTLQFSTGTLEKKEVEVSLYWLNEETDEWVELENIVVDWEKGTVSGTTDHFTKFAVIATPIEKVESEVHFTDINGHWAEENIRQLTGKGAANGYPDGTFKPDNPVTRAEFVAMMVHALGLTQKHGKVFADTADHWARQAISTASAYGIIHGYDHHIFAPDERITREQMAMMIVNALQLENVQKNHTFADQGNISSWAQKAVVAAVEHGIIAGYTDNTVKPQAHATRAEAVTVLLRAMEKINR